MSQENATAEVVSADQADETTATATPQTDAKDAPLTDAEKEAKALRRRVDRLTADRHADRAELARYRAGTGQAAPHQQDDGDGKDDQKLTEKDVETRAEVRAREIAEMAQINKRCDEIADLGAKESKEFKNAFHSLNEEVGGLFYEKSGRPTPMMEAILDAESPHKLILHLSENPDLAGELEGMKQTQRIRRIVQIEREMTEVKTPKQSAAPKPVQPVKAGGGSAEPDPKDTAAWIKFENEKLLAARRK